MRRARLAAAAALLAFAFVLVPTSQASAAVAPTLPDPINVLPSTIKGSFVPKAGQGMEALYAMVYRSLVTPAQASAAVAVKAGTATVTEAQLVASFAQKFKGFPATKAAGLIKGVGAAAAPIAAFDVGLMAGNGVVELAGWGDEGTLCTTGNDFITGWVSVVNGKDCAGFLETASEFPPNTDVSGGISGPKVCQPAPNASKCITLVGLATYYQVAPTGFPTAIYGFKLEGGQVNIVWTDITQPGSISNTTGQLASATEDKWRTAGACYEKFGSGVRCIDLYPYREFVHKYQAVTSPTETTGTPAAASADPVRRLECRLKLSDGSTRTGVSEPFQESEGVLPDVVCPDGFPPELRVDEVSIWEVGGGVENMLSTQAITPEFSTVRETMADCLDGSCILDVVSSTTGSCNANPGPCADWYTDPNRASKYSCNFGTHVVDLGECTPLAPYYKPGAKFTDRPLGDPTTGQPVPNPGVKVGTPTKPDVNSGGCVSSGWGDPNPIEWVLAPVRCAIYEAFVPSVGKVEVTQATIEQKYTLSPPGKIAAAAAALNLGAAPSGCDGLSFDLGWIEDNGIPLPGAPQSAQMLNACPGDVLHPWAVFVSLLLTGGVLFILIKTVPRLIGGIFGYGGVGG